MRSLREILTRRAPLLLALVLPWALLWPLPVVFRTALVTSPLSEGVTHLWIWWAAWTSHAPLSVTTKLLNYPDGLTVQVIDPLHLVPFALGWAFGPAAAFNAVLVWGVVVAGLGGLLLAREAGAGEGGQALGVAIAASAPTLLAVGCDGIAEGMGVGWVAVQLACLLALRRGATPGRVLALGASLAAGVLSGPYNAIWIAILDVPVGIWLLRRTRSHLIAALGAGILCSPYLLAISARDPNLPGGEARAGLGRPLVVMPWRASAERGVDLLDLFVPAPLTGGHSDLPHTAYLGVVTLALAAMGVSASRRSRGPAAWPWMVGMVVFAALALGPWLSIAGSFPTIGGRPLVAPAGLLALYTPLGRLSRWYRAGAVAVFLLIPLAVRAVSGRRAWVAALAVLLDARLLAPLPRSLPTYADLPSPALIGRVGPIAELPPIHPMFFAGDSADLNLLLQMHHGQPTNGTVHSLPGLATNDPALRELRRISAGQPNATDSAVEASGELAKDGYQWLAVYRGFFPGNGIEALVGELGTPAGEDERVVVWRIGR